MPEALTLGFQEWVALPDLGLPAVKAKVDTGARTSALHAASIEPFGSPSAPMVRFVVRPHPTRSDIAIVCSAPVIGRRDIMSSNGDSESRYVIETRIAIGGRVWPIEVTLTNREAMSYRMLLGRQAIGSDMIVEPGTSFRQPRLSYRPYRNLPRRDPVVRPLRIALVTRRPDAASNRRLAAAAGARRHAIELIDPRAASLTFRGGIAGVEVGGGEIGHFDAIIPRIGGAGGQAPALIRQFETMGGYALNSGDALERLQYPATVIQALVGAGVAAPLAVVALDGAGAAMLVRTPEETLRLLVVDHKTVAAIAVRRGRLKAFPGRVPAGVRRVARLATRALRLGLAAVDVAALGQGFAVVGVTAAPLLSPFERLSGVDAAAPIIAAAEAHVRSWSRRAGDDAETGSGAAGG